MTTKTLDHIVHLSPPGSIEEASSAFRNLGFDVIPGGTHTNGLTSNALVVLPDGVYIELIAFVHASPPPPPSHRWGTASPGWIDYAHLPEWFTPDVDSVPRVINTRDVRHEMGLVYTQEVEGGRETPDGKTLRWRISAPDQETHDVGKLPFFCRDVTPRAWRVPEARDHPSTVQGISYVRVLATSQNEFNTLRGQLNVLLNSSPIPTRWTGGFFSHGGGPMHGTRATWLLKTPKPIPGLHTELILEYIPGLNLDGAQETRSGGIYEVGFWVKEGYGVGRTPYGRIVWTQIPQSFT